LFTGCNSFTEGFKEAYEGTSETERNATPNPTTSPQAETAPASGGNGSGTQDGWITLDTENVFISIPPTWKYDEGNWGSINITGDATPDSIIMGITEVMNLSDITEATGRFTQIVDEADSSQEFVFNDGHIGYMLEYPTYIRWVRDDTWMGVHFNHGGAKSHFTNNEDIITAVARTMTTLSYSAPSGSDSTGANDTVVNGNLDSRLVGKWQYGTYPRMEFLADGSGIKTIWAGDSGFTWSTEGSSLIIQDDFSKSAYEYEIMGDELHLQFEMAIEGGSVTESEVWVSANDGYQDYDTSGGEHGAGSNYIDENFEWVEQPTRSRANNVGGGWDFDSNGSPYYVEPIHLGQVIEGVVRNISGKTFSYVQITYTIFDAQGNQIGTAIDTINNLGAGNTWRFSATFNLNNANRFVFSEISAW